ncbi:hypothetical protein [Laspinema palackyanum]
MNSLQLQRENITQLSTELYPLKIATTPPRIWQERSPPPLGLPV